MLHTTTQKRHLQAFLSAVESRANPSAADLQLIADRLVETIISQDRASITSVGGLAKAIFILDRSQSTAGLAMQAARFIFNLNLRYLELIHGSVEVVRIGQDVAASIFTDEQEWLHNVDGGTLFAPAYDLATLQLSSSKASFNYLLHVTDGESLDTMDEVNLCWRRMLSQPNLTCASYLELVHGCFWFTTPSMQTLQQLTLEMGERLDVLSAVLPLSSLTMPV